MAPLDQKVADAELTSATVEQMRIDDKVRAVVEKQLMLDSGHQFPVHFVTSLAQCEEAVQQWLSAPKNSDAEIMAAVTQFQAAVNLDDPVFTLAMQ